MSKFKVIFSISSSSSMEQPYRLRAQQAELLLFKLKILSSIELVKPLRKISLLSTLNLQEMPNNLISKIMLSETQPPEVSLSRSPAILLSKRMSLQKFKVMVLSWMLVELPTTLYQAISLLICALLAIFTNLIVLLPVCTSFPPRTLFKVTQ